MFLSKLLPVVNAIAIAPGTAAVADEGMVGLMVAGQASTRGMPLSMRDDIARRVIVPRFPLRPGTTYSPTIDSDPFATTVPPPEADPPRVIGFAPSQAIIPANSLRIHLTFSEPVAGGITTDGGGSSLAPTAPWMAGRYRLIGDPELEGISGNTPYAPFDARVGAVSMVQAPIIPALTVTP